ncbi:MAG: helix-turn-helix transcriptional regulator [Peptostreptococcaceae bacterium]|nr:helix-turn-helix transcriptional regulator [Peptostreptococcaceae bacterium]
MRNKLTPFGIVVKKRLLELGMTQGELAKEVGVNQSYLSDVLYGNRAGHKYREEIEKILNIKKSKQAS